MDRTTLGATGLSVSVAGLGCGGNSQLGLGRGASHDECVRLVREATDLGVNLFDTAEAYGTETIVGDAISAVDRGSVVVSTKSTIRAKDTLRTAKELATRVDTALTNLKTDYVDVYHLHAVLPRDYEYALNELAPVLVRAKEAGKVRHIGITETSPQDPLQETLLRAVHDAPWEVMMLALHMMNQKPRKELLPNTLARGVGTLIMFAVRNVFSQPDTLANTLRELARDNKIPTDLATADDALGFLVHEAGATSITDAAYRYARHQPGVDVVLFGTGNVAHLRSNIESLSKPPLPPADVDRLHTLFGELTGVGLVLPNRMLKGK